MARVLILEDEAILRSAMARGIGKLAGVTVLEAGTVQAALDHLDTEPPAMIISDIDLPDRSGLELLGELGRRRLRIPVLFVSAYLKAYAAQIPPHADVDVREKPIQLDELRAIVEHRLAGAAPTEEAPFGPADYLQLACLGHRSVVIEIEGEHEKGSIVVHQGTLWAAQDGEGEGEPAFRRLAFVPRAAVRVRVLRDSPGRQTIQGGWEQLLIDAARRHDEAVHNGEEDLDFEGIPAAPGPDLPAVDDGGSTRRSAELRPQAPLDGALGSPPESVALGFDAAFEAGVEALLSKDYPGAFAAFERADAIRPNDSKVVANLERLRQLGHGPSTPSDP